MGAIRPAGSVSTQWLALREPADSAARSTRLVTELLPRLRTDAPLAVHDLGCGTGSMLRWLAPRLPGPQHWICHDRDDELLAELSTSASVNDIHGANVAVDVHVCDITRLEPDDLAGATLITTSALLDILTATELARLATTLLTVDCPVLLTLSVTGQVELVPPDAADERIRQAFNTHQRRTTGDGRGLLGPAAARAATDLFTARGATVLSAPSAWRLGAADAALIGEWLTGWVGAACEQDPELADWADDYLRTRLDAAADGQLEVTVHHQDLLIVPGPSEEPDPS
jgi:methyltransferase family protein